MIATWNGCETLPILDILVSLTLSLALCKNKQKDERVIDDLFDRKDWDVKDTRMMQL